MDHRWGIRKKIGLDLSIFDRGVDVGQCKSTNVSHSGIFAETSSLCYPKNTALEIEVVVDHLESLVRFRLHAIVVHSSDRGLGLMFSKMKAGVSQTMMDILLADQNSLGWTECVSCVEYVSLSAPERLEQASRRVDSLLMR